MAYLEEYNEIRTDGGYLIKTPERIRQYIEIEDYIIVRIGAKPDDKEYKKNKNKNNVFCYDNFGSVVWEWEDFEIADIKLKNNKLILYCPSHYGYQFFVDVKTGNKEKVNITK